MGRRVSNKWSEWLTGLSTEIIIAENGEQTRNGNETKKLVQAAASGRD